MRLLQNIHQFDLRTFEWCLRRKHRELTVVFSRHVSRSADGPLYAVIIVVFMALGNWPVATLMLVAFALERTLYFLFKSFFRRNRPAVAIPGFKSAIVASDQFSFPSGHTSAAFLVACALHSTFPFLVWVLYPWACCVGAARVMLGVHFPTDILAGALLGTSVFLLVASFI